MTKSARRSALPTKAQLLARVQSSTSLSFLGPPPLLKGENRTTYSELATRVSEAVGPKDFLEEMFVRDVVDLEWEIIRLRRLKASLIKANWQNGIAKLLEPIIVGDWELHRLVEQWASHEPDAVEQVDALLASAGPRADVLMACSLSFKIDEIERIDRMIMNAEGRRNGALRELDRHRATLAEALRRVTNDIEDAEFEEIVGAKKVTQGNAA